MTTRARLGSACRRVVESSWFDPLMLGVIAVNAVTLGLETYDSIDASIGSELHLANEVILGLFVVELLVRLGAHAQHPGGFFRSGWNVFDFIVIAASFVPGVRENATLLRLVRLLRIARAVRLLPDLRVLTIAVGRSIPGVASLAAITLLLVYIYGMIGWVIFHDHDPANFDDIGQSMVTMFVLLTLENLPAYIERGQDLSDWTLLFYVSYVLLASFLIFNLSSTPWNRRERSSCTAPNEPSSTRRRPTTSRRTPSCSRSGCAPCAPPSKSSNAKCARNAQPDPPAFLRWDRLAERSRCENRQVIGDLRL
jgi:voltage-gated sodium channel